MLVFKDFIKSLLPEYIIQEDSYKDLDGKGFIVRFLEIFGEELDEQYYNKIEELQDQLTPGLCQAVYLDYFAVMEGDFAVQLNNEYDYRQFLQYLLSIYQVKGRKLSYEAMLGALGLTVVLTEIEPLGVNYDNPEINYDDEGVFYDISCATCSDYNLDITGPNPISPTLYQKILELIALVEPINATLGTITYNGSEITALYIDVQIDENGDLVYNNDVDPDLILTLVDGDLIVSGPNADRYFIFDGDLYFTL